MRITDGFPVHHYPDYIRNDEWTDRKMEITVKVNENLSQNLDEMKKIYEKSEADLDRTINNTGDFFGANSVSATNINNTKIINNTKRLQNAKSIYTIVLPLPNELMDQQNHAWEAETSVISTAVNSVLNSAIAQVGKESQTNFNEKQFGEGASKILGTASNISKKFDKMLKGLAGASPKILANASSALGFRKPLVDPGWFANYSGTRPRFFNFSFDLIPNNAAEAENILNIILNLKKFSLPRTVVNGVALLSPYTFEIKFGNSKIERLINMSNVVLNNMDVNYSADGNMQMFPNGMPTYIRLSMQFMEANVVTSEFY